MRGRAAREAAQRGEPRQQQEKERFPQPTEATLLQSAWPEDERVSPPPTPQHTHRGAQPEGHLGHSGQGERDTPELGSRRGAKPPEKAGEWGVQAAPQAEKQPAQLLRRGPGPAGQGSSKNPGIFTGFYKEPLARVP